jgi:hypothetical protein
MLRSILGLSILVACGNHGGNKLADACIPGGPVSATIVGPASYVCQAPYMATVTVVNGSCEPIAVQGITLSAVVTTGACEPPSDFTYKPKVGMVEAGQTAVVLDLTGNEFCCINMACPTPFQCDETYTATVNTGGDPIVATNMTHLSLDGCDVICP